jgi:pimeloyl-ACP methyl ester carboxylesterase
MKTCCAFLAAGTLLLAACGGGGASVPVASEPPTEPAASATAEQATSPTLEPSSTFTAKPTDSPTPEPVFAYETETVGLTTHDGLRLAGTFFHSGDELAVLFVHMSGENDQRNWIPAAEKIAERGFSGLTIDLRCFGESECRGGTEPGWVTTTWDLQAGLNFLRAKGFNHIVCAGASMGGRACVTAAFDEELAGIVVISGTRSADPDKQDLSKMLNPGMPKLFIVGESDPTVNIMAEMTNLYENSPEPKASYTFPDQAHGTDFFRSPHAAAVSRLLYDFLYGIRDAVPTPGA